MSERLGLGVRLERLAWGLGFERLGLGGVGADLAWV